MTTLTFVQKRDGIIAIAEYLGFEIRNNSRGEKSYIWSAKKRERIHHSQFNHHSDWGNQIKIWSKVMHELADLAYVVNVEREFDTDYYNAINENDVARGFLILIDTLTFLETKKKEIVTMTERWKKERFD